MTTKQYTEEDFAAAEFARHPDGAVAARFGSPAQGQWRTIIAWLSDEVMAAEGWVPVREATAQPITLDALQAAWKNAEQAEWAEPGDVLIWHGSATEGYTVRRARSAHTIELNARILRRAPKPKRPEGAEELSALMQLMPLEVDIDEDSVRVLVDWLAERGVRVTEGEK